MRPFLWLVCSLPAFATDPAQPVFKLPDTARPTRYQLDLRIDPDQPVFEGAATIDVQLQQSAFLWMNGTDLTIHDASIESGGKSMPVETTTAANEFIGFYLRVPPGPARLVIHYAGKLSENSSVGIYRKKAGDQWYAFTTFTAIEARRAFPCFDEPRFKTPWELTLHVRREHVAVANSPMASETPEPGGMKRVTFAPTEPIASEVVAFAVGPFDVIDAGVAGRNHIPVRIITPKGRGREAAAARTATGDVLARLETYTGIPYPWAKLDHIALLEGAYGAVENPGLITYRDRILLAAPERDTLERQRAMRGTMAHELAHQWFGNLVTQAWWDDVWLSEGFATWLGGKIADMELAPFERGLAAAQRRHGMLFGDTDSTRPVRVEMNSRKEMSQVYSRLVYQKGGAILTMLEDWIGPERFQRALHRYLTAHRFANATTADLAAAIREESGIDPTAVLASFLNRPGSPTFRFQLTCNAGSGKLAIDQGDHPWTTPVCLHSSDGDRRCEVMSTRHTDLALTSCPAWIEPNAFGGGYYRSILTGPMLESLVREGYEQLTAAERYSLAADLAYLTSKGLVDAGDVLKALPRIARDNQPAISAHAGAIAIELALAAPDSVRAKLTEWLRQNLGLVPAAPVQSQSLENFLK